MESRVRKAGRNSQAKMSSTMPALILKKFGTNDAKGNLKSVGTFTFFKLQASTFFYYMFHQLEVINFGLNF